MSQKHENPGEEIAYLKRLIASLLCVGDFNHRWDMIVHCPSRFGGNECECGQDKILSEAYDASAGSEPLYQEDGSP